MIDHGDLPDSQAACSSQEPLAHQADHSSEHSLTDNGSNSERPASEVSSNNFPIDPEPAPNSERRPRGKIGRMAKADRDKLNFLLRDGLSYPDAIEKLGEAGKRLT